MQGPLGWRCEMETVMEMKIADHEISKVCTELESEKYLGLANQSAGYAKLCCYAVKKLNENQIVTTYENICVALWLMFPKFEKFHLKGFDDMPDTDYMEKVIKLRSTPKEQDYLTGGNVGFDKSLRSPWKLTRKGQIYAEEAERIFSGETEAPANTKTETKKTSHSFENTFRSIWQSDLYQQFTENQIPESVDEILACATLDMNYSPRRFSDDFNRKISNYENDLKAFEKDISDKRIEVTRKFLAWLKKEVK